jgi:hypothetical protein
MTIRSAALLLALCLVTGCIVLPVPIPPTGTRVDEAAGKLVIGETTRAEVHALLGPPNRLATDRHEVFELERDPFHFYWIIMFGGPGYATGTEFRSGEAIGFGVTVAYDAAGRVEDWRWLRRDDGRGATGGSGTIHPPQTFANRELWRHDAVLLRSDGALLLIGLRTRGRIDLVISAGAERQQQTFSGDLGACGSLQAFSEVIEPLPLVLLDDQLVSVPLAISAAARPCDWHTTAPGLLTGVPRDNLTIDGDGFVLARLAGTFVVLRTPRAQLDIRDLDGDLLASTEPGTSMPLLAADRSSSRLLLRLPLGRDRYRYLLYDRPMERLIELSAVTATAATASCARGGIALSPDGLEAALLCNGHLQRWALADPLAPSIASILPVPNGVERGVVAYADDGTRLLAGRNAVAVWRTADGVLEAYLPDTGSAVVLNASSLVLTPDGNGVATGAGFWQLVAPSADPGD